MSKSVLAVILFWMFSVSLFAHSAQQGTAEYTHIKPLLIQAIDAPDGKVSAVLTGDVANFFKRVTRSSYPVMANVTTVGSFDQPGCKRLNLHLQQRGVETTTGELRNFDVAYGINFCRDGDAPQSSPR